MARFLPFVAALVVIIGATVYEGVLSNRWTPNYQAERCAALLREASDSLKQVGPWELDEDEKVNEVIKRAAGAVENMSRRYKNTETGEFVGVWLMIGHAHDAAEHTPDSCYPTQGFQQDGGNQHYTMEVDSGQPAEFWTGMFVAGADTGAVRGDRVFWTWFEPNPEGGEVIWQAPENPRFDFGASPALFKLYFTTYSSDAQAPPEESAANGFAKAFLPELNKILVKANQPIDGAPVAETATAEQAPAEAEDAAAGA